MKLYSLLLILYSLSWFMKISQVFGEYVSMLFLTQHEDDLSLISCFNELLQIYDWLFIVSQKRRRHKRPLTGSSCKIFSQWKITFFKESMNLLLILSFYSIILFVNEIVFISRQITDNGVGTLLEIGDNLEISYKLNIFSWIILQCLLITFWDFS